TIMRICAANGTPFDTFCTGLPNTDDNRQTACESGDKTRSECVPTIARVCAADGNPFADLCTGTPNITATRATYCTTNGDVAACPNVNYGKWRDSFKGEDALPTAPANLDGSVVSGLLSGLTTTAPVITGLSNSLYSPVTFADFNGGDGRGGSVYWLGTWTGNSLTNFHAGILTTTDVGAPLTSDLGGSWVGRFRAYNDATNLKNYDIDFTLTIDFAMKKIHAFIEDFDAGGGFAFNVDFEIEGVFDPTTGVLSGSVEYGQDDGLDAAAGGSGAPSDTLEEGDRRYSKGVLTGLIGQHGAAGAFLISASADNTIYIAGGFVAVPKNLIVNHADWAEGLGVPETAATSRITETITDHARN
ncbi:MAG: hypothetical protein K8953_01725, partial [Proteobacteria bacterium]|nr:hypothetical protein [Pseudomonadota bacterium]